MTVEPSDPPAGTLPSPRDISAEPNADEVLALLSLYLSVPRASLDAVWPNADLSQVLAPSVARGSVTRAHDDTLIALAEDARVGGRALAERRWGIDAIHEVHHAAIRFWLGSGDPCSAVFHHEQLGETGEAIELLKDNWHSARFELGFEQFLKAVQRLTTAPVSPELLAIQRLLVSMPWASGDNPGLNLQLLNVVPTSLERLPLRSRAVVTAASILSLTAAGRLKQAIALGEGFVAADLAMAGESTATWEVMAHLWNALAEAYVNKGSLTKAAFYASKAERLARAECCPFPRFRALAIRSMAFAMNGEFKSAVSASESAWAISEVEGWGTTLAHFPLLLAEMLSASAILDQERLARVQHTLATSFPEEQYWASTAVIAGAQLHLARGELAEGVTLLRRARNSTGEWGFTGLTRAFALDLNAELLLASNSAADALILLAEVASPAGHAVCLEATRASALILAGRPRDVLRATDACIAMGAEHCLRTLPPVLIRRALALQQLGLLDAADQALEEAFLLMRESLAIHPLLNLPSTLLDRLWSRLRETHPEYEADIVFLRTRADNLPAHPEMATDLSSFTSREITLVVMLRNGAESLDIARELFLSTNTVKVHLRNIYRKLGVHTRAEALVKIESAGFDLASMPAPRRQRA